MREKLTSILESSAAPEATAWLAEIVAEQRKSFQERPFYYAFSGVSRRFDKKATVSAPDDPAIDGWDEFRVARILLLLTLAEQDEKVFLDTYAALLDTADLREQVALFSALPWLPCQEQLVESAVDGLRSNVVDIFDSIALNNSFPAEHFTEEAWNQMVLKAIFIQRPLYRIIGLAKRRNRNLAEAISDLAHERWAAGRTITPEAWRNAIDHLDERLAADLRRIAGSEDPNERAAAALVLAEDDSHGLSDLAGSLAGERSAIESGRLDWNSLGRNLET